MGPYAWGPFDDADVAALFAQFATREIDPAEVILLHDPNRELLSWYNTTRRRGGDKMTEPQYTEGAPEVHTGTETDGGRVTRPDAEPRPAEAPDAQPETDESKTDEQS